MRHRHMRRTRKPAELLLVPMIDIFTVLVTFLLMTAVFSRIAILEHFNAELCELLAVGPVTELLQQLVRETPIMMVGEDEGWLRLHPLAREFLLGHFEALPATERSALHARASHWYKQHGRLHDAARHALAAGDEGLAQEYAARALWMLGALGKLEVLVAFALDIGK